MSRHGRCDDFHVLFDPTIPTRSPYRLVNARKEEIAPLNEFLDATALRGLSSQTLRTYAYSLMSVWKWMSNNSLSIEEMTEAHLVDYIRSVREQVNTKDSPAARSINLRLVVLRSLYRFHTNSQLPKAKKMPHEPLPFLTPPHRTSFWRPRRVVRPSLRVKVPRRLIVPLRRTEVVQFFESFRTWRDFAITSLMLFCGLRSREVLTLRRKDLDLVHEELRVWGKGDKDRLLPLAPYARTTLSSYLRLERPETDHETLFVSLKGKNRGHPMTPAGLRDLFRFHRKKAGTEKANPHRFRHTFASDMVREGVSLPVLMRLMGHSNIGLTMRYVNLSAEDVRKEFVRVLQRLRERSQDGKPLPSNP